MTDHERAPRSPRRERPAELIGWLVLSAPTRVKDISLTGMAVEGSHPLLVGRHCGLRLGDPAEAVELTARVVWCFRKRAKEAPPEEAAPLYRSGLEFENVLSERARDLLRFLDANAMVTLETRLCGRFDLRAEEIVHLSSEVEFQVRSLSATGLLIEAEVGADVGTPCFVELPEGAGRMRLPAGIAYTRRLEEGESERSELGLEFGPLSAPQEAFVAELVARLEGRAEA